MSFASFHFKPEIAAGIKACGYLLPTPIQQQALPPLLAGRDILGLAQTGTGKTAAFLLPILTRLQDGPRGRVRALIVAPTRELAEQINDAVRQLGCRTGLRSVTIYGGVSKLGQLQKLRSGVEIVIACPGRLLDHLSARALSLSQVEVLVLDEADQMFDMGFLPDIRRILKYLPSQRQTMLFSATMPEDLRHLVQAILRDPVAVQIDHQKPAATIAQTLYPVASHLKASLLLELLQRKEVGRTLIFTRTKHGAKGLAEKLEKAGHRAASLQGNLSQTRRREVLEGFRAGTVQVLVATDIAARGIDVAEISHVINFDMPETAEAYVHRIGRTGRATRSGAAFSLASRDEQAKVRAIEKLLGRRLEQRQVEGFVYSQAPRLTNPKTSRPARKPFPARPLPAGQGRRPGQGPGSGQRPKTHQASAKS